MARKRFEEMGFALDSVHATDDPVSAVQRAEAIAVGGGNTWMLQHLMLETGIMDEIRRRVLEEGIPYIGWSAGANVACITMRTTNDMPIVEPSNTKSLGLVSVQLNAHYRDPLEIEVSVRDDLLKAIGFLGEEKAARVIEELFNQGESRDDRLYEFVQVNGRPVLGLYEGTSLRVLDNSATLYGKKGAKLIGKKPDGDFEHAAYADGADVSLLMQDVAC